MSAPRELQVYRHMGTWVFDAPEHGLEKEPFIEGAERWIDWMIVNGLGFPTGLWNTQRCRLEFSAEDFEYAMIRLTWKLAGSFGGDWYVLDGSYWGSTPPPLIGWLCPALLKYFPDGAPKEIYAAVKETE